MPLKWRGKGQQPCFFPPDRMENVRHDAPDGSNMTVVTSDGEPVFGRFVSADAPEWFAVLRPGWEWV